MYIITLHIDIILKICIKIVLKYREINVGLLIHISVWLIHNMNYQVQFGINISEINVSSMKWSMSLGSQTSISLASGNTYAFNFGSFVFTLLYSIYLGKDGWDRQLHYPGGRTSSLWNPCYSLPNALPQ